MEKNFYLFMPAFRKRYITKHVHIRLLEERSNKLDKSLLVRAVLMDLSKAFDCEPFSLIVTEAMRKTNNTQSTFEKIISGMCHGSIPCVEIYKTINKKF